MSQSELQRLIADIGRDAALARRILDQESLAAAVDAAQGAGYDVTLDECATRLQPPATGELSDADLQQVAGGKTEPKAFEQLEHKFDVISKRWSDV